MKLGISKRYALWFSAISLIILASVLLATIIVLSRSSNLLRDSLRAGITENFEAFQHTTMYNLAEFMRSELFTPLYRLDIESIDRMLKDLRKGMPIISICIADDSGKVLTDGTDENLSYGKQLQLDRKRLESTPILIETIAAGDRITFQIGIKDYIAGYGEVVFSEAPLQQAIALQDEMMSRVWRDFGNAFMELAVTCTVFIALLAVLTSFIFSRTLSRPLIALRDATGRIAGGELDYRVEIRSRDELGDLATSFNRMVEDLQKRTAELAMTNEALRESEERMIAAKNAAEAANWAKSEFLANMSHEMRTPLAGALGMLNLVLEMDIGDQERQLLEMAKRSTDSLLRLISDLLDFSRLEAGIITLEKKMFSIPEVIRTAIEVVSIQAREKGLHLSWKLDDSVPEILNGDEGRLRQVLVNLLGNAVKFTKDGEVEVEVRRFHDPESAGSDSLLFSVRDTGIGIPPDQTEKIFGKFTQVDASWTRKHGGTGLGLALSRQIVEMMGGRIWAESRVGAGSTFYFTCPL